MAIKLVDQGWIGTVRKDQSLYQSNMAYAYNFDDVDIVQEKLTFSVMEVIMHLVQESEKQKADNMKGGAAAGPAASLHEVGEPTCK